MHQRPETRSARPSPRSRNFDDLNASDMTRRGLLSISRYKNSSAGIRSFFDPRSSRRPPVGVQPDAFIAAPMVIGTQDVFVVQAHLRLDVKLQHGRIPPDHSVTSALRSVQARFYGSFVRAFVFQRP